SRRSGNAGAEGAGSWSFSYGGRFAGRRRGWRRLACRRSLRLGAERLDVLNQLQQLFFGNEALKRGHDRLEARGDLRARIEDRLADVALVGDDRLAVLERDGLAKQPLQHGPASLQVRPMAGDAGEVLEQLLARGRQRALSHSTT